MGNRKLSVRESADDKVCRYTFILEDEGTSYFYVFNDDPYASKGVNQYCGSSKDGLMNGKHLGELKPFPTLPEPVRRAIFERYQENREDMIRELRSKLLEFEKRPDQRLSKDESAAYDDLIEALKEALAA